MSSQSLASYAAATAALLTVVGCSATPASNEDELSTYRLTWAQLPDGSDFATSKGNAEFQSALRCWDGAQEGKVCIAVSKHRGTGALSIGHLSTDELPAFGLVGADTQDGYACGALMGRFETISKKGTTLVSNRDGSAWGRGYVEHYMSENGVGGTGWFPCLAIADAIQDGSLATLGTTKIDRGMAGNQRASGGET